MKESFAHELGRYLVREAGFDKSGVLGQALGTVGRTALRGVSGMSPGPGNALGSGGVGQSGPVPPVKGVPPAVQNLFAQFGTQPGSAGSSLSQRA